MDDPTNWNVADVGSFEFASPEEAKKAEVVMNRAMRESFENGKNVAFEEAAKILDSHANMLYSVGRTAAGNEFVNQAHAIRALKRPT